MAEQTETENGHEGREPEDTQEAENVLREALGDEVVDKHFGDNDERD